MHGRKLILNEVGKEKIKINYRFNFNCAQAYEKFFVFLVLVVTIPVSNSALSYKLYFSVKFECPILLKSTLLNLDPAVSA